MRLNSKGERDAFLRSHYLVDMSAAFWTYWHRRLNEITAAQADMASCLHDF